MRPQAEPGVPVLQTAARLLARETRLETILDAILGALTEPLGIASSAVFVAGEDSVPLRLVAWTGFADPDGLAAAVRRPDHPITAAFEDGVAAFDIRPVAPGGPALRAHLPLLIRRDGSDVRVGVLAIAYDNPMDVDSRRVVEAVADLLAVAIQRDRP
jgi:GAF domain-containing protein